MQAWDEEEQHRERAGSELRMQPLLTLDSLKGRARLLMDIKAVQRKGHRVPVPQEDRLPAPYETGRCIPL